MRIAYKMLLVTMTAIAAMAFAVSSASAQETGVEVRQEGATGHCNPCIVHVVGESHIRDTVTGMEVSTCADEFVARIYENGTGEVEWVGRAHGAPGCNLVNCAPPNHHWPIHRSGELGGEVEHMRILFCLRQPNTGVQLPCEGEVRITRTMTPHIYEFRMHQRCAGGTREVEGHWFNVTDNFELFHLVNH